MATANHSPITASRALARKRPEAKATSEFVSEAETRALMEGSAGARANRLAAADMLSTDQAAELNCTSRVTINAWIAKGRAIGLSQVKRGYRLPAWQFNRPLWDVLPQLFEVMGIKEGWAMLAFLEAPHGGLDGISPREAIEQGRVERVVELAARALDA